MAHFQAVLPSQQPVAADDLFALEQRKRDCRDQLEDLEYEDKPLKYEEERLLEQLAALREQRTDIAGRKSEVIQKMRELNREEAALLDRIANSVPAGRKRRFAEGEELVNEAHDEERKATPEVAEMREHNSQRQQPTEEDPAEEAHRVVLEATPSVKETGALADPTADAQGSTSRRSSSRLNPSASKQRRVSTPKIRTLTIDDVGSFVAKRTKWVP